MSFVIGPVYFLQMTQISLVSNNSNASLKVKRKERRGKERGRKDSLPRTRPPPPPGKQRNRRAYHNSIIHILGRDRPDRREQEHHADEEDPDDRDRVQRLLHPAQHIWPRPEVDLRRVDVAREDDGDVGEVERRRRDVEDRHDGLCAADADAVEQDGEDDDKPDGVDGRVG